MKRPLVVKLGSSLVVGEQGRPRRAALKKRAAEIAAIVAAGTPVCVVSSGAIALGLRRLGLERRPSSLPRLQAASALGQAALQRAWQDALDPHGLEAAQILLTSAEIAERRAYVNVRNALGALFALGSVPVINENDATATDEISFGDNDALAAHVAVLVRARLLVLLTSVPGVLRDGVLIEDGAQARAVSFGAKSPLGRGGMESKVAAAELAAAAGIPTVIAGETPLTELLAGRAAGTRFDAGEGAPAFKLWLRHGKRVAGRIVVDAGAKRAVIRDGGSLLAVGVTEVERPFRAGDGVEIVGPDGEPFARGVAAVDAGELAGRPAGVEAVHRDRLVLLTSSR
ncbi:MAG TPA: glutamate 5-kinase [Gaiellaceae bacterium]|jgi:glutamate 5-kinase|nr:glutamate 5-kinase [Gaiellaceae bacterium]